MNFEYFTLDEFDCQETGENKIDYGFVVSLDKLREACQFPFVITSGYRSPEHSAEKSKPNGPGMHSRGLAADIAVANGHQRFVLANNAMKMGFRGIGIAKDFVHVDLRASESVLWVY
jgi:uncharacterized protein YcbK (DUF882 family)